LASQKLKSAVKCTRQRSNHVKLCSTFSVYIVVTVYRTCWYCWIWSVLDKLVSVTGFRRRHISTADCLRSVSRQHVVLGSHDVIVIVDVMCRPRNWL